MTASQPNTVPVLDATSAVARAPLISLDEAISTLLGHALPLQDTIELATFDADGRVLAQDLVSNLQVPAMDNSAMDGYALRVADVTAPGTVLPVSQRIVAGSVGAALQAGTAARIFTGAPVPSGADAVVMQESCEAIVRNAPAEDSSSALGSVRVMHVPRPGQAIRRAAEDIALGSMVLPKGLRLDPAALGLAASIGAATLPVIRRPRVALFSTGDELVMPGALPPEQLPLGSIYNSNRFFLRALLQRLGCEVSDFGIVPDNRAATQLALQQAAQQHDLVLSSGGVSVGEEDHVKPAVQALGNLHLWSIAMKPGKPFAYGHIRREKTTRQSNSNRDHKVNAMPMAHFIGLPGNPVSSFITFLLLVRPFLLRLQGIQDVHPLATELPAHFDWPKPDARREFLRVRRNAAGGLDIFPNQSSGVLTSAVWADGLVDKTIGQTIHNGELVRFISFSELLV